MPQGIDCLTNCIYSRDDKPGSKYCFAVGVEEVHCLSMYILMFLLF